MAYDRLVILFVVWVINQKSIWGWRTAKDNAVHGVCLVFGALDVTVFFMVEVSRREKWNPGPLVKSQCCGQGGTGRPVNLNICQEWHSSSSPHVWLHRTRTCKASVFQWGRHEPYGPSLSNATQRVRWPIGTLQEQQPLWTGHQWDTCWQPYRRTWDHSPSRSSMPTTQLQLGKGKAQRWCPWKRETLGQKSNCNRWGGQQGWENSDYCQQQHSFQTWCPCARRWGNSISFDWGGYLVWPSDLLHKSQGRRETCHHQSIVHLDWLAEDVCNSELATAHDAMELLCRPTDLCVGSISGVAELNQGEGSANMMKMASNLLRSHGGVH